MRKYLVFAVVALPVFLGAAGATSVAVAFPAMVTHFQTSLVLSGWVLSVYQLVAIGAITVTSKLSDTLGRRLTFMLCVGAFTIGSFLCAIASDIGWLIFFRVIQAAGGGGFIPAATGLVTTQFPQGRQKYVGLLTTANTFGQVVGPGLAGVMVEYLGWQSVFWLNVPLGIATLVLALRLIKPDAGRTAHEEMDFLGVGLITGFVSAVMISLTLMDKSYAVPPAVIVLTSLLGLSFLAIFIYRLKQHPTGAIDARLLTRRPFMASNIFNFAFGAGGLNGIMTLLPLYATTVYGMSALESGLLIIPRALGMLMASVLASFFMLKWGYRSPTIAGALLISFGLAMLALEPNSIVLWGMTVAPIVFVTVFALIAGIGTGVAAPPSNNACIDLMPEKAASITGVRQISRQMGGAIGIAVSALVLQSSSNTARGFTLLLFGFCALQTLAVIAVFWMPRSPRSEQALSRQS